MSDGYRRIDTITDRTGDAIEVAVLDDQLVGLRINGGDAVWLGAQERDRFAKAWAEAERRAEARTAQHTELPRPEQG